MDAVTQILIDRSHQADRVSRMVLVSLLAHLAILAALTLVPTNWGRRSDDGAAMTIDLSAGSGPVQGRNSESAKPVQQAVPETAKPKNDAPPALTKPEMEEPVKTAKTPPKAVAKNEPPKTLPQLHSRTPTQGAEVKEGTARIETHGAAVPFGGLATGGGNGGDAYVDTPNFCCPEYLTQMKILIQRNWNQNQGQAGTNQVKFTILRDGTIENVAVEKSTVSQFLDAESQRALLRTRQLPPLPPQYTNSQLTVHLVFEYRR